jgi:endoglucanase
MEYLTANQCLKIVNKKFNASARFKIPGKTITLILLFFLFFIPRIQAQSPSIPFPHHTKYVAGSIKPNRQDQYGMDTIVEGFYNRWKHHYISKVEGKPEYYVYCNADGNWHGGNKSPNSISLSEGHGYGMIIMVMMAGYDPEARSIFNGMLAYFKDHPSSINPHLMAWNQTTDTARTEHNSDDATDGDLDIAFALILADRQWGSTPEYDYRNDAIDIINALKQANINPESYLPMMGDFTEKGEPFYYDTRPSDFMCDHFKLFSKVTGDTTWNHVSDKCYALLKYLQQKFSPKAGIFPDFVRNCNKHPVPAGPYYMEKRKDGDYSYNACRLPFRLGCDYLLNGDPRAKELLDRINKWISREASNDPYQVKDGYRLNGKPTVGASGDNIAFIGPFGVAAMANPKNQVWLNRLWDYAANETMSDEEYYGNTLKMLSLIVMSGNWWN